MILERAIIHTDPARAAEFEKTWKAAIPIPASTPGFLGAELLKGIEAEGDYLMLIRWRKLSDHTVGFRESELFSRWRSRVGPFFVTPPDVEHYDPVAVHLPDPATNQEELNR